MAGQRAASVLAVALVAGVFASIPTEVQSIGVCNGMQGNNLPSGADVVQLYQSNRIAAMRIYEPHRAGDTLRALDGTTIDLIMDVGNDNLAALASDPAAASAWVRDNVQPYQGVRIKYIAVGNEVTGGDTQSILPAMKKLNAALAAAGRGDIKVSTAVKMDVLSPNSSPPSNGVFRDAYMAPIVELLASSGAPLLANVYTYFAYRGDQSIELNYALFQPSSTTVNDKNGLTYTNLFDAMVDAVYAAMEKVGGPSVPIVVSESGWPSAGGIQATVDNARTYNQGLIDHVGGGTPKRRGPLETYIFAMFNENQKTGDEIERHFGLFNPDKSPAYPITFPN